MIFDRLAMKTDNKGLLTIFSPDADKPVEEIATIQCVHCGRHWRHVPGSGKIRGFCMRCNGPFCGPHCEKCVPTEQMLENIEKGMPLDFVPATFHVPWFPRVE